MKTAITALLIALGSVVAKSPELIPQSFEENLASKNLFIKFYAPW
jgi:hypothetical protein